MKKMEVTVRKTVRCIVMVVAAAMACGGNAYGQLVPALPSEELPLWIDLGRIYSFNKYEKSRWGIGLYYGREVSSLKPGDAWHRRLWTGAYLGYGHADKRFKWGAEVAFWTDLRRRGNVFASYIHDLTPEASRLLTTYEPASFMATPSFMARLFGDTRRLTMGYGWVARQQWSTRLEVRISDERKLYGPGGTLYPHSDDEWDALERSRFVEARLAGSSSRGMSGEVVAGHTTGEWWTGSGYYARVLLQYLHQVQAGRHMTADIFVQVGGTTPGTPFSRLFNLGGTWGSPLQLGQSLLTARPDEFAADAFALTTLRIGLQAPLFSFYNSTLAIGTAPRPFVMAAAEWGVTAHDQLTSPEQGLAEVGAGIDGLVRWGVADWGVAVAYRLAPHGTLYRFDNWSDNLAVLLTATLVKL